MNLVVISFYVVTALMALGLLSILLFGVRSLVNGKVNIFTLVILCIPIVLLVVLGFVVGFVIVARRIAIATARERS